MKNDTKSNAFNHLQIRWQVILDTGKSGGSADSIRDEAQGGKQKRLGDQPGRIDAVSCGGTKAVSA